MTARWSGAAAAITAMTLLVACSSLPLGSDGSATARPTSSSERSQVAAPPMGSQGLDRYYEQRLSWSTCGAFQCATLTVPLDYADPGGQTVKIEVLRVRATGKRLGSLVVNPGGPGASGVDYAAAADYIVTRDIRRSYDVVGFDPRGVGRSQALTCLDARETDELLGADPTPDNPLEQSELLQDARDFAQQCRENAGPLLEHVSSLEVVKDMDVLRAALGETKLDYLGKSYGTLLGALYAEQFPGRVGRFVLDGAVAPDLSPEEFNLGQAVGFETATRAYVAACVRDDACPLGSSTQEGLRRLQTFLRDVDAEPLASKDRFAPELTEGWASLGVAEAMYSISLWPRLTSALRQAFRGDGSALMVLASSYARRQQSDGSYRSNLVQVIYAVNCLDRPEPHTDAAHFAALADRFARQAPTWGRYLAWSPAPCSFWPVRGVGAPKPVTAQGSGPIVVVGTTRDPATPYVWSKRLADQLADGHLVTYDGDGHTAYMRSNACLDGAVDAFLLRGAVPPAGLNC